MVKKKQLNTMLQSAVAKKFTWLLSKFVKRRKRQKKRECFKNRTLNMSGEQNEIVSCILEIDV